MLGIDLTLMPTTKVRYDAHPTIDTCSDQRHQHGRICRILAIVGIYGSFLLVSSREEPCSLQTSPSGVSLDLQIYSSHYTKDRQRTAEQLTKPGLEFPEIHCDAGSEG